MAKKIRILGFTALASLLYAPAASAQLVFCGRDGTPECTTQDLYLLIYRTVNILISMAGLVAILFVVIGGAQMMMSGGDSGKVGEGKKTITNAILGLILIMASYLIVAYVANVLALPGDELLRDFLP